MPKRERVEGNFSSPPLVETTESPASHVSGSTGSSSTCRSPSLVEGDPKQLGGGPLTGGEKDAGNGERRNRSRSVPRNANKSGELMAFDETVGEEKMSAAVQSTCIVGTPSAGSSPSSEEEEKPKEEPGLPPSGTSLPHERGSSETTERREEHNRQEEAKVEAGSPQSEAKSTSVVVGSRPTEEAEAEEGEHREKKKVNGNETREGGNDYGVAYIRDDSLALCDFSFFVVHHAMKPWRLQPVHELVDALGLPNRHLTVVRPPSLSLEELAQYHSPAYLKHLCLDNAHCWNWHPANSSIPYSGDCPPVEGIMEYVCGVAAGSLFGATLLNHRKASIAINWAGGLHHARAGECAGFCYVNDIALSILELLKVHRRVLYIDLDVHHGDGVEEAFVLSDRVLTMSLHKYGEGFFPGTGSGADIGVGPGRYYSLNLPLPDGVTDFEYVSVFNFALGQVVDAFEPEAVVLQCGTDSLAGDRVGVFNLSSVGHGRCVEAVMALRLPLLVVGGGGYNVRNVAKCWAYETALLCGANYTSSTPIPVDLPSRWLFEPCATLLVPNEDCGGPDTTRPTALISHMTQLRSHVLEVAGQIRSKRSGSRFCQEAKK